MITFDDEFLSKLEMQIKILKILYPESDYNITIDMQCLVIPKKVMVTMGKLSDYQ